MNDPTSRALRLIERDKTLRAASQEPSWASVKAILDYIATKDVQPIPELVDWLCVVADSPAAMRVTSLIDVVVAFNSRNALKEANRVYRTIFSLDGQANPEKGVRHLVRDGLWRLLTFSKVVPSSTFVVDNLDTWGNTVIGILGRLLLERQRSDWSRTQRHSKAVSGDDSETGDKFSLSFDDGHGYWYFGRKNDDHDPRKEVATLVGDALRECISRDLPGHFDKIASELRGLGFALGFGLICDALLVSLEGGNGPSWVTSQVVAVLSTDEVANTQGFSGLRRLMRRHLKAVGNEEESILRALKAADLSDQVRVNELSDIESWQSVTEAERALVAAARSAGELYEPFDPRKRRPIEFSADRDPPGTAEDEWPNPEERTLIALLLASDRNNEKPSDEDIANRVVALETICQQAAAKEDRWRGEVLSWCWKLVHDIYDREVKRLAGAELTEDAWRSCLDRHATWWKAKLSESLEILKGQVPEFHHGRTADQLSWGSNDTFVYSLRFAETVLAVRSRNHFLRYQEELADAIDASWKEWPNFSRALVLMFVRAWYWANQIKLRKLLEDLMRTEEDPHFLKHVFARVVQIFNKDLPGMLDAFLAKANSHPEMAENIEAVGYVLGDASLRGIGTGTAEGREVFDALVAVLDKYRTPGTLSNTAIEPFINGVLNGCTEYLANNKRSAQHASRWLDLVRWTISQWPFFVVEAKDDNDRFPLLPVFRTLESRWPTETRRMLYQGIMPSFIDVLKKGTLGDFCWLHFEVVRELEGDIQGNKAGTDQQLPTPMECAIGDQEVLDLCRAAVDRLGVWRAAGKWTNDLGWMDALSGGETARLMRKGFIFAGDKGYMRLNLPPLIDALANAGCSQAATDLRLFLRQA